MWETFENTCDVGKVLEALALSSRRVACGPNLALQDVLDRGNPELLAKHVSYFGPLHECRVALVRLNLDPKVGAFIGNVD